ncbi:hypothetical protein [Nitrospirillum amazonense]|uniref:hypothetical protein n=1 Tax=Nitrospirillum amazonense TaxID=28077 RepID=UPI002412DEEB|nr:hypothetical protein [Nitrospirillum amazonense]MDG3441433.1 hypothetical protein [Nitrospirillum amazonense]
MEFMVRLIAPEGGQSIVIEDDGRVGYAYFLDADDRIRGDVWLYNRCTAPKEPEWHNRERAPFANSAAYVCAARIIGLPTSPEEFSVTWDDAGALIFLRGEILARVADGAAPGWSVLASKDGPLAKAMSPT